VKHWKTTKGTINVPLVVHIKTKQKVVAHTSKVNETKHNEHNPSDEARGQL